MTISSTTNRNEYTGAGSTGPYAYTFRIFDATDLRVIKRNTSGVASVLTLSTDYTVTGVGESSGNVTLVTALASGETLVLHRIRPLKQLTDLRNQGNFFPESIEDALDSVVMVAQQLNDGVQAAFKLAESYDPANYTMTLAPESGKVIGWDSTGLVNLSVDGGIQGPVGPQGPPGADGAPGGGGTGEANTVTNVGSGSELAKTKVGLDIPLRTLVAGSGISLTQNANDITINATGAGGGGGGISEAYADTKYLRLLTGGQLSGSLGIGITPSYPLHISASVPGDKVASIRNTSSSGFGLKVRVESLTNYAFKVSDNSDNPAHQMWSCRVGLIGNDSDLETYLFGDHQHSMSGLAIAGLWGGGISSGAGAGGHNPAIMLKQSAYPANGGNDAGRAIQHMIFGSGNDSGLRIVYNFRPTQDEGVVVGATSFADESIWQGSIAFEQDGALSISGGSPHFVKSGAAYGSAITPTTWDGRGGKDILLRPLGFYGVGGGKAEYVGIACGQIGRGIEFGVVPTGGTSNVPDMKLRIKGDGGSNPLWFYVGGSLQNIVVDGSGFLKVA